MQKDYVLWDNFDKEIAAGREQKWPGNIKFPAWMDFPEKGDSEGEEDEGDSEELDEGDSEEVDEGNSEEEVEGDSSCKMKRKKCIAWILARKKIYKELIEARVNWTSESFEVPAFMKGERKTEIKKEKKRSMYSLWNVSDMDRLEEIELVIWKKKAWELELSYVMKRKLKEAQENNTQLFMKLKANNNYLEFRNMWITIHSCWGGEFEDITNIIPMDYTDEPVPRYVWGSNGLPDTLQIFEIKVLSRDDYQWPLCIYGMVAVRDCIDQRRIIIFNRQRHDCQILTREHPYLVLTGPTRSVVMRDDSIPVTIEAELKVKNTDESEDNYLMLAAARVPSRSGLLSFDLNGRNSKLRIDAERINKCVEAVVFVRAVKGTWPIGFRGYIAAETETETECRGSSHSIVLSKFGSDGPISDNGDVDQTRCVCTVEVFGKLMVFCHAWNTVMGSRDSHTFLAMESGRSIGTLNIGSCTLEILVAWSLIRPVCEELVRISEMAFT